MQWIITLVIGGIIGWLASIMMKSNAQMGWIANILVGIVGSVLGFWVAGLIGLTAAGGIAGFLIAVVGAVLLIALLRLVGVIK
jgi:uncharacterized membrane protein YeaQ/YmgE (transglycosylase-associated protein family)